MADKFFNYADRQVIFDAFTRHLQGRFPQATYAVEHTNTIVDAFTELCTLHGMDSRDVFQIFFDKAERRELNAEELAKWKKIKHPAFMDLPEDLLTWVMNFGVEHAVRSQTDKPIIVKDRVIGFYINGLPQPQVRRVIHKLELTSNQLPEGDEEAYITALGSMLHAAEEANMKAVALDDLKFDDPIIPGTTPGIPEDAIDILQALEETKTIVGIDKSRKQSELDVKIRFIKAHSRVSGAMIDTLRKVKPEHIDASVDVAKKLAAHTKQYNADAAAPVSPTYIYEQLYGDNTSGVRDPILYAWAQTFAQQTPEYPHVSLSDAWAAAPLSRHKPKADTVIIKLLAAIDANLTIGKKPIYSVNEFADAPAISALLTDKSIKSWVPTRNAENKRILVPSTALAALAERTEFPADYFFDEPKVNTAPKPDLSATKPSAPVITDTTKSLVPLQQAAEKTALIQKTIRMLLGDAPDASESSRITAILNNAYHNPSHAIDDGMPSLPHMWLLWAADESSRVLPAKQLFQRFATQWGHSAAAIDNASSIRASFAMAAISSMASKGEFYSSYQQYLEAATRALPASHRTTVPKLAQILRLEETQWNQSDRNAAPEALAWLDAQGGNNFLGHTRPARHFIKRLRDFVTNATKG